MIGMYTDTAIRIDGLSKSYTIRRGGLETQSTLVESAISRLRNPLMRSEKETFWALRDINLEIKRGEVVGIVGRNGAGKSTLLKVLSRITPPTTGEIQLYGRVGSLLEVGTGFHPELTGRENIFLNGAVLGMTRPEIKRQFNDIVEFAGVEKFIETPVKRYSSGMYVRLAFSVAAHLPTEILIIDEVLAVGDAQFQSRCIGKMQDVSQDGRTVLLVSHQMNTIQSLADSCVFLRQGQLIRRGATDKVVQEYLEDNASGGNSNNLIHSASRRIRSETGFRFTKLEAVDDVTGSPMSSLISGKPVRFRVHYDYQIPRTEKIHVSLGIKTIGGTPLAVFLSENIGQAFDLNGPGVLECVIDKWPVTSGQLMVSLICRSGPQVLDWITDAGVVNSEGGDYFGTGRLPKVNDPVVLSPFEWNCVPAEG